MDKPMTQVEMLRWWAEHVGGQTLHKDLTEAADTIELQQRDIEQLQGEVRDLNMRLEKET
jgi:hypothetical protein